MLSKRERVLGAATLTLALVAWFYSTPLITLHHLRTAAAQGNSDALYDHINLPEIRENFKAAFRASILKKVTRELAGNPSAAADLVLATSLIDSLVEVLVTPEALSSMILGEESLLQKSMKGLSNSPVTLHPKSANNILVIKNYAAWDRYEARLIREDTWSQAVVLTLTRQGLVNWKLTSVQLSFQHLPSKPIRRKDINLVPISAPAMVPCTGQCIVSKA